MCPNELDVGCLEVLDNYKEKMHFQDIIIQHNAPLHKSKIIGNFLNAF